jgi:pentatricopeptide repeat protein
MSLDVDSLVNTYKNCNLIALVFDLLIRTYVQDKRMREAIKVFHRIWSSSFLPSIIFCNILLGGLVKVSWMDLAW